MQSNLIREYVASRRRKRRRRDEEPARRFSKLTFEELEDRCLLAFSVVASDVFASSLRLVADFNQNVNAATLQAADLVVDGGPQTATSVNLVDADTVAFFLPSMAAGAHSLTIAAGAIVDTMGTGVDAFSKSFAVASNLQFTVKHNPRLQPGNAPLSGYAGSALDRVDVLWQTIPGGSGTQDTFSVEYRPAGSVTAWQTATLNTSIDTGVESRVVRSASITGLNWNSDYTYRVRHRQADVIVGQYESTFHTRKAAGDATAFSFAAYGDSASGTATGFRQVQSRINQVNPAFSVLLGDNVYNAGSHQESDARFDPVVNPEAAAWMAGHIDYLGLGNHDVGTASGLPSEQNYSVPIPVAGVTAPAAPPGTERTEHSFSWDYGNIHFVTFDTNSYNDSARLDGLLNWVVADLNASTARWKIVYGHHPVAGVPDKPEAPGDNYYQQVVNRLKAAGVDLFMTGHSHTYSWTYPLTGQINGTATYADHGMDDQFIAREGLPQLVSGVGGVEIRTGDYNQFPFVAEGFTGSTAIPARFGFSKVDVTQNGLTVSYVAADNGAVIDSFVITKEVTQTLSFQQGVGGYTGTVDTFLHQNTPNTNNGAAASLKVDNDDPAGTGFDAQTLLRFDNLFGSGAGQIPTNATLRTATLQLQVTNASVNNMNLHRMLLAWSASDTWNTLGAGVQNNGVEALASPDTSSGQSQAGVISFNVLASLQAWLAAPASNRGWAFLPTGTDGVDFNSSEGATKPKLIVTFHLPPAIIDNGDAGFSTVNDWTPFAGQGFQNDVHYSDAGSGLDIATWTFTVPTGLYRVAATWSEAGNRATNAPFTVLNGATPLGTVRVNQELAPSDFSDSGANWKHLGVYSITNTLVVQLSDDANEYVIADAIRIEAVDSATPRISITDVSLQEGNFGTTNFPFTVTLSPSSTQNVTVIYSTANGTATATTDYTAISGTLTFLANSTTAALLTVQVNGDLSVEANETFFLNLSNASANAEIADVQGLGTIANGVGPALTVNNTVGANFAVVGNWPQAGGQGFQNDVHYNDAGTGTETATWTRSVTPGWYRVSTTWTADVNRASNAPYTILNNATPLATVLLNQEQAPNDLNDAGTNWEDLGVYNITSGTLVVRLSDDANEFVIADALRIEPLNAAVPRISIGDVSLNEGNSGTTNFVFTVSLAGASGQTVTLNYSTANGTAVAPGDYAATSGTLTFSGSTTTALLTVAVMGDTVFEPDETFYVNLGNAANAAIADVQAVDTIVNDELVFKIDSGDPGFTTVGTWFSATGQGFMNDVHYKYIGTGTETATWSFSGLTSGMFQVWATWTPDINRATNAPYTITGGASPIMMNVNQELAPVDLFDMGVGWKSLGTVTLTGSTLTVTLSDNANEFVIADAIRIFSLGASTSVPTISVDDVTAAEGTGGSTDFVFSVRLSEASSEAVAFRYSTADGTASAAEGDYAAIDGTLTFEPGATLALITVPVTADSSEEPDETFFLNLSEIVNAASGDSQAQGVILNDDEIIVTLRAAVNAPPPNDPRFDPPPISVEAIDAAFAAAESSTSFDPLLDADPAEQDYDDLRCLRFLLFKSFCRTPALSRPYSC